MALFYFESVLLFFQSAVFTRNKNIFWIADGQTYFSYIDLIL